MLDTVSKDMKRVWFKFGCTATSLNNEPWESEAQVGVSGGSIVLPRSECDEIESLPVGL